MRKKVILNIVISGIFIGLISISSLIRIPIGTISITLQTLFVFLIGMMLGSKWGVITILCYLIIGLLGIPVFANGGGLFYILEPSFGYLLGFLLATFVIGLFVKKDKSFKRMVLSGFIGLIIIYCTGLVYLFFISKYYYDITIDGFDFLVYYFLIPLPIDIISIFISSFVVKRLNIIIE
ncbi:MAG: biotin transporter BioY [Bacilli bacterium]|nr:biotin transporter BioY [Bacilli bacterium]